MTFQPATGQTLTIDGIDYVVAEHPSAPGIPYGQQGRKATVYQMQARSGPQALKVFAPRFREPLLVGQADRVARYAAVPGLRVCRRTVLTARRHPAVLRVHPDLAFAVLMHWIDGPTWMEVVLGKRALTPRESLALARALAEVLAEMEERGLAHGDLSGGNVILPALAAKTAAAPSPVELVDVEEMYSSELDRPTVLPGGSPGYAHRTAPTGLWGPEADRFSGAVLLAEMLGWCDPEVRAAAWGEQYFSPEEMQEECHQLNLLSRVLRERWGDSVAGLLERAWRSDLLRDCPTFTEWLVALPERVPEQQSRPVVASQASRSSAPQTMPEPVTLPVAESEAALLARLEAGRHVAETAAVADLAPPRRPTEPSPPRRLWPVAAALAVLLLGGAGLAVARWWPAPPAPAEPDTVASAPKATPQAVPHATPQATPQAAPQATPQATPQAVPQASPQAVPQATPQAVPQATPQAVPQATPPVVPQATPQAAPQPAATTPQPAPLASEPAKPVTAVDHYKAGSDARVRGDYDAAIASYTKAIALDPKLALAYYWRGLIYSLTKSDYQRGVQDFTSVIKLEPRNEGAWFERGRARFWMTDYQGGIDDVSRAIEINPNVAQYFLTRGDYLRGRDWDRALADFDRAIQLDPKNDEAYERRAWLRTDRQQYQKAFEDADAAVHLNGSEADNYYARGWCGVQLGNYSAAVEDYTRAISLTPYQHNKMLFLLDRGRAHINLGHRQEAIADLQRVVDWGGDAGRVGEARAMLKELGVQ